MGDKSVYLVQLVKELGIGDLKTLLSFFGRNIMGPKDELLLEAIDLIEIRSSYVEAKILELHRRKFKSSNNPSILRETQPQSTIVGPMTRNFSNIHRGQCPSTSFGPSHVVPYIANSFYPSPQMRQPYSGMTCNYGVFPVRPPDSHHTDNSFLFRPGCAPYIPQSRHLAPLVNPEVKTDESPFNEVLSTLLGPTCLSFPKEEFQERVFYYAFYISSKRITALNNTPEAVEVHLKLQRFVPSWERKEFPDNITVKINENVILAPGRNQVQLRRKPKSLGVGVINITNFTKRSTDPNEVSITWASPPAEQWVLSVSLVQTHNSQELIEQLKGKGSGNKNKTTNMIKMKLSEDNDLDISATTMRISLICPFGKQRMELPCRAETCSHVQCFDAGVYVKSNELKPKWNCPICNQLALYKNLVLDELFLDIISKAPESSEVEFQADGSWNPVLAVEKQKVELQAATIKDAKAKRPTEVISVDSDSEEKETLKIQRAKKTREAGATDGSKF